MPRSIWPSSDGRRGPLFVLLRRPEGIERAPCVMVAPPFAEEMNKTRPTLAIVGQALVAQGVATVLADLYGIGDSAGEFRDGDWDVWLDDLKRAAAFAEARGCRVSRLLAVRLGCILRGEWVSRGQLRVAASMMEDRKETVGVLVVGGPQYRVGSHRQFVLMVQDLAAADYPVLRFDCPGMGDAEGALRTFEEVEEESLAAFRDAVPGLERVVLWGLCDAASAILRLNAAPLEVVGRILVNPWARTEAGEARACGRHYYLQRILQRDFWRELATGALDPSEGDCPVLRRPAAFAPG